VRLYCRGVTLGLLFLVHAMLAGAITPEYRRLLAEPRITIAAIGDVMCHASQLIAARREDGDYSFTSSLAPAAPILRAADLTIANLETTLPGKESDYSGYPRFGAPDALAEALAEAGVDLVTVANNHILDKGKDGMLRTVKVLERLGLQPVGAYPSVEDWRKKRVRFLEVKGYRLAVLAYTYWTNGLPTPPGTVVGRIEGERIAADLRRAEEGGADAIIVCYHFGDEGARSPSEYQRRWVDFALRRGADIVFGSHPHVVQGYTVRMVRELDGRSKRAIVFYSLGNFISGHRQPGFDGGIIARITLARNPDPSAAQALVPLAVKSVPVWVDKSYRSGELCYRILPGDSAGGAVEDLDERAAVKRQTYLKDIRRRLLFSHAAFEVCPCCGSWKDRHGRAGDTVGGAKAIHPLLRARP
jgi:poly-gamma-glutamate synthesis protein (capsule biosynthesis protein)